MIESQTGLFLPSVIAKVQSSKECLSVAYASACVSPCSFSLVNPLHTGCLRCQLLTPLGRKKNCLILKIQMNLLNFPLIKQELRSLSWSTFAFPKRLPFQVTEGQCKTVPLMVKNTTCCLWNFFTDVSPRIKFTSYGASSPFLKKK